MKAEIKNDTMYLTLYKEFENSNVLIPFNESKTNEFHVFRQFVCQRYFTKQT